MTSPKSKITTPDGLTITLRTNPRAKSIILRQTATGLFLTTPPGISDAEIARTLPKLLSRLNKKTTSPTRHYADGDVINSCFADFTVGRQSLKPDRILIMNSSADGSKIIGVGSSLDITNPEVTKAITRILIRYARTAMQLTIIPWANRLAESIHCRPTAWKTGSGLRTLGTCSSSRIITLSPAIAFLPDNLLRYVVFHELAHLTHMNHSHEFHALCNNYCGGLGNQWRAQLKSHRWQLIR